MGVIVVTDAYSKDRPVRVFATWHEAHQWLESKHVEEAQEDPLGMFDDHFDFHEVPMGG